MYYILTDISYQGAPGTNPDGTFNQSAIVTIGISGDTFGFYQKQNISIVFGPTDSVYSVQQSIITSAQTLVNSIYNGI
jgi:hypothetical protein